MRLRRSDCTGPGIGRRRRGRGFEYRDATGAHVGDAAVLDRIRALAIPPAWRDVWICADERGHLQATGIDDAGRKQYLYHERWRARRERQKFDSMLDFGRALPRLRTRIAADLEGVDGDAEPSRERVLAGAVRLLDLGLFRIGSDDYAERNGSYGLTTLRKRHVEITPGDDLRFDYPAKSGLRRVQTVADPALVELVGALARRRGGGTRLLAHRDGDGWHELHSDDVNAYIKDAAGGAFSAKDFRTWNATVLAAVELAGAGTPKGKSARERAIRAAIAIVAEQLGNTPAVCRASYVDPRLLDRFRAGHVIDVAGDPARPRTRARIECALLDLLD